jgi:hypothetical protein
MTNRILVVSVIGFVCAVGSTTLARQARPTAPPPPPPPAALAGTGVITGTLTSADAGQPVRKATVRLMSASPRLSLTATTDERGRFEFTKVPAGEFTLSASRPGYLDTVLGARRPGPTSPGTVIRLLAGQKLESVSWTLARAGVIAGTVVDEFGDPAFNVPVRAVRFVYTNGFAQLINAGSGTTDDRGMYRVAGLMPGEYLVSAVPRETVMALADQAQVARDRAAEAQVAAKAAGREPNTVPPPPPPSPIGYVATYHPSAPSGALAQRVAVDPSQEVFGIDIRLQLVRTLTVAGAITSSEAMPQTRLQLIDASMPMSGVGIWFRDAKADGTFAFPGVVPGSYILKGFGTPGGPTGAAGGDMWGSVEFTVSEGGTSPVTLPMRRGVTVTGSMNLEGLPATFAATRARVSLMPVASATDWEMASIPMTPAASGQFSARNVLPGMYRVTVTGLPEGWTLSSAMFGGRDAADHHLRIDGSDDVTNGRLTFTDKTGIISGAVTNLSGAPVADHTVVLFPTDSALWLPQSRRIQTATPTPDGRYAFRGLPPGEYHLALVLDPDTSRLPDPAWLKLLVADSASVKLGEGETRGQDLRVR